MPYRNKALSSKTIHSGGESFIDAVHGLLQPVSSDVKAYILAHWSLPERKNQETCSLTAGLMPTIKYGKGFLATFMSIPQFRFKTIFKNGFGKFTKDR